MDIKTKFAVNDKVWIIKDNKVFQTKVTVIKLTVTEKMVWAVYTVLVGITNELLDLNEQYLFSTKEELLATL